MSGTGEATFQPLAENAALVNLLAKLTPAQEHAADPRSPEARRWASSPAAVATEAARALACWDVVAGHTMSWRRRFAVEVLARLVEPDFCRHARRPGGSG